MIQKFYVSIHQMNEKGQKKKFETECDSLQDLGRLLITFKPTRNYEVIGVNVIKGASLL